MRYLIVLLLAGCGGPMMTMTLYPRGGAGTISRGTADMVRHVLTVTVDGQTYSGNLVFEGGGGRSSDNKARSVLLGPAGTMRCEIGFAPMFNEGVGSCLDAQDRTYDVIVR